MAAVAAATPYLLSTRQLAALTDQVLAVDGHAVRLRDSGRHQHTRCQQYTHTTIVAAELTSIESAAAGLAQITREAAELCVSTAELAQGFTYSAQQRAVLSRLLTAGHTVDAVLGTAGAGKTTLMAAARAGWEAAGLRVVGASTAAVAAANLAAEAGIDARTIAAWTRDISGGRGLEDIRGPGHRRGRHGRRPGPWLLSARARRATLSLQSPSPAGPAASATPPTIRSAIAVSRSCLVAKQRYRAPAWTPSASASRRMASASSPDSSSRSRAVWMVRARLSRAGRPLVGLDGVPMDRPILNTVHVNGVQ